MVNPLEIMPVLALAAMIALIPLLADAPTRPFTTPRPGPVTPPGALAACAHNLHSHLRAPRRLPMTQTSNRFFDEVARLMNDAAGVATGVRREFDTLMRTQAERVLRELDVVQREEFEAVKEMARLAREENEALKARIAALEAKLGGPSASRGTARRRFGRRKGLTAPFGLGFLVFPRLSGYKPARLRLRHPWRHAAWQFTTSEPRI